MEHLSLKEIERAIVKTKDLEEIQLLFSEFMNHFTVYEDILSNIKNEYAFVINGLINIQKEKEFLKFKIQNLSCQNGHEGMLNSLRDRSLRLKEKKESNLRKISDCESTVREVEKKLVIHVGKLYKETLSNTTDDRQRMLLAFKGRIGFIKDWLLYHGSKWSVFLDLYQDIDRNPKMYKELLSSEDDYTIEKYDSPEVKKVKTDISDQTRKSDSFKRELEKVKDNISRFQSLIIVQDAKIQELQLLVQKKVKKTH